MTLSYSCFCGCSYHCQYGPEDHNGKVKTMTSLLLPKQRPKVVVASIRCSCKKTNSLVKGDVFVTQARICHLGLRFFFFPILAHFYY